MDSVNPAGPLSILYILTVLFCIVFSLKAAFTKCEEQDMDSFLTDNNSKVIRFYHKFHNENLLTTDILLVMLSCFIGITFYAILKNPLCTKLCSISNIVICLLIVVFVGMTILDAIATKYNFRFLRITGSVLSPFMYVLFPLSWVLILLGNAVIRLFKMEDLHDGDDITEDDILLKVNEGREQGVLNEEETAMIESIFEFSDKTAGDIMTPRAGIVAIDDSMTVQEVLEFVVNGKNSRYPVMHENLNNIVGILYMRDLLKLTRDDIRCDLKISEIKGLLKDAINIVEFKKIDDVFNELKRDKKQLAIVKDEYSQTVGLLTMEDILEEIVGNIFDEYDQEVKIVNADNQDSFVITALTPIEDIERELDINFDTTDYDTLNGYMISKLEHIPEDDEKFETTVGNYSFKILTVKNKVIQEVLVTKHNVKGEE